MDHRQQQLRQDLAAAYRLMALDGMDDGISTHISVRVDANRFLLNPFGLRFEEVTADSLISVDEQGNVLDDPTGLGINPAGFTIHSAIHGARSDALCVLHAHTVAGVAVSCLEEGLLPLNQWAMQFYQRIGYHDYEGIALDLDERECLIADLGDHDILLLRNHGTLTVGRNVGEAFIYMYFLMKACEIQVKTLAMGPGHMPPQAALDTTAEQAKGLGAAGKLAWPALLRKLERMGSDYAR